VRSVLDRDGMASGEAKAAERERVDGRIGLRRGDLVAARDELELSQVAGASRRPIAPAWSSQRPMPGSRPSSAFRPSRKATRRS
jgi:hypothetical protein